MSSRVGRMIVISLLTVFAIYTCVAVVVAIASGRTHGRYFWPTVVVLGVLAAGTVLLAYVLGRRLTHMARVRKYDPPHDEL
jgi:uncharacterized integral membrane protein